MVRVPVEPVQNRRAVLSSLEKPSDVLLDILAHLAAKRTREFWAPPADH